MEFVGKLERLDNNGNGADAFPEQNKVILTILEKIKET